VTLCVVYTMHKEMRSVEFLVEPQNQGLWFVSGLTSKPLVRFVSGLVSKSVGRFLPVWLKTDDDGFLSVGLKTGSYGLMILVLKSPRRFLSLDIKIKRTTVCRLCHKNDGRLKTAWGTRQDLASCFA
jgi:hypothetical protein